MGIDELLKKEITEITEDENNYYVKTKPDELYDDTVWKVDKKTKKIEWASYVANVVIRDLKNIDVETFKNNI